MTTTKQKRSAKKELARQQGKASTEDLELSAQGIDVSKFLTVEAQGHKVKVDFSACITEGYIERTMEGANVISVTIHDGTREILRSGMFGTNDNTKLPVIDVKVDGLWYRLASFQKNGFELTLEFEDRIVFFLKRHHSPLSASRAHMTRAEFIGMMLREVKTVKIRYFCPELHRKQPVGKIEHKKPSERERRAELAGGLLSTTDLTVKKQAANKSQLEIMETVLDTGSSMGANRKVLISSIMCIIQESDVHNDKGTAGVDVGAFNQNIHDGWPASGNVAKDAEAYFKQAIENDKSKPEYTLAELVQSVQKSGAGASFYAQWRQEAEKIVEEYGGKGVKAQHQHTRTKEYDFHRGPPDGPAKENTWEASERLAKEVNWRRFVVGMTFYFVDDHDLIHRKPTAEISEDSEGIEEINGTIDAGIPVSEAIVRARATRWWCPPGSVVKIKDTGPFNGRWLVFSIHRDLFSEETEVKLHHPEAAKPEPANETEAVQHSEEKGLVLGGHIGFPGAKPRELIVEAAKWGLAHKSIFTYKEIRPMPKSLFSKSLVTDCSGFATLCYKAAGVQDPNGLKYNGEGFTGTLRAHGQKTNKPEPGDLVFYSNPEHVAVYIGEGKVIEFGGPGGPHEEPINYRTVTEVRTYELAEEANISPKPARGNEPGTPVSQRGPTPEHNLRESPQEANAIGGL
jgi:hypothetical protein